MTGMFFLFRFASQTRGPHSPTGLSSGVFVWDTSPAPGPWSPRCSPSFLPALGVVLVPKSAPTLREGRAVGLCI